MPKKIERPKIIWQIVIVIANRFLLNTAKRFIYPFAPVLSRSLGVSLGAMTFVIAANHIASILSLLFGPIADRRGYRSMMLFSMILMGSAMLMGGLVPCYASIFIALFFAGLGKSMYDPSVLAFVGKHVSYRHRGMAVGIAEISWAGSSLIGIPVAGFLIEELGWRSPFIILGTLGIVGFMFIKQLIPDDTPSLSASITRKRFSDVWRVLRHNRMAMHALIFAFLFNAAGDLLFVIYGAWMESHFRLDVTHIGISVAVIGAAELTGEILTASLSDRLGLERALVIGLILASICYVLLPFSGYRLSVALANLFVLFMTVEFTIVTSLSYFTEIMPDARATMMAAFYSVASIGRGIGSIAGGIVWFYWGIWGIGMIAGMLSLSALIILIIGLKQRKL